MTSMNRFRWLKRGLGLLLSVLLISGIAWYLSSSKSSTKNPANQRSEMNANRAQVVSAAQVRLQDVRVLVSAIGTLTAKNTAIVRSRVDAELLRVYFQEGQMIQSGDLLAQLDDRSFKIAQKQAQGQLSRDLALLKNAELDLERYRNLWNQNAIAKQQLDTQAALVDQLKGTVQMDRAALETAQLQLSYTQIKAPISGRLGLKQADLGNMIRANDANGLVSITQTQPMNLLFAVPEMYATDIQKRLNNKQTLNVAIWDKEQNQKLEQGFVISSENTIDNTTGTIRLKAELPNPNGVLFPNQFVNVQLHLDTQNNALLVPSSAIQRGSFGTFVYVIQDQNNQDKDKNQNQKNNLDNKNNQDKNLQNKNNKDNKDNEKSKKEQIVKIIRVETGLVENDWISIKNSSLPIQKESTKNNEKNNSKDNLSDNLKDNTKDHSENAIQLKAGDWIVTDGADRLRDGAKIEIIEK